VRRHGGHLAYAPPAADLCSGEDGKRARRDSGGLTSAEVVPGAAGLALVVVVVVLVLVAAGRVLVVAGRVLVVAGRVVEERGGAVAVAAVAVAAAVAGCVAAQCVRIAAHTWDVACGVMAGPASAARPNLLGQWRAGWRRRRWRRQWAGWRGRGGCDRVRRRGRRRGGGAGVRL
jgi:hypothetical protein